MKKMLISLIVACLISPVLRADDHAKLLPAETIALVSVDSWANAAGLWNNAKFVPLEEEDRKYQDASFADQFGMSVETFGELINGRVTRAMLSPDALTDGATVIIADVDGDKIAEWKKTANLKQVKGELYSSTFVDSKKKSKTVYWLFSDGKIAFSQQQKPLADMAGLAKGRTLADDKDWTTAKSRFVAQPDAKEVVRFEWFSRPQYQVVENELAADDENAKGMFQRHGLDAVTVLAGCLQQEKDASTGEMSATVLATQPYRSTLAIFNPVEKPAISVPDWAFKTGRDGTVLLLDFQSAAQNVAVLFDETYAEGIEGTYFDLLEDIKSEDGMGLDVETELFAQLGPTFIYIGDESESAWLAAIEVSDAKGVAETVRLLLEDDPDVTRETFGGTDGPFWKMTGTGDMADFYLHVSDEYLFCTSTPEWVAAAKGGRNAKDMEQWHKDVSTSSDSREIIGLAWMKPDKVAVEEYSTANGLRGWFLDDYLESKTWWNGQNTDDETVGRLFDTPLNSRNGFYGAAFQETGGGWTFYWKFQ